MGVETATGDDGCRQVFRRGPLGVVSGAVAADSSTGVAFDGASYDAPTIVNVPGAGTIEITGFAGDTLVYVKVPTLGNGICKLGSHAITWP